MSRRLAGQPLPRARFLPGHGPHPRHSLVPWLPTLIIRDQVRGTWLDPRWLYGLDLYDTDYLWEAHEVWEGLWLDLPRKEPRAQLVQGMIQLAAARLTRHLGRDAASDRLHRRGADRVRRSLQGMRSAPPQFDADSAIAFGQGSSPR